MAPRTAAIRLSRLAASQASSAYEPTVACWPPRTIARVAPKITTRTGMASPNHLSRRSNYRDVRTIRAPTSQIGGYMAAPIPSTSTAMVSRGFPTAMATRADPNQATLPAPAPARRDSQLGAACSYPTGASSSMLNSTPGSSSSSGRPWSVPSRPGVAFWLALSGSDCPAGGAGWLPGGCELAVTGELAGLGELPAGGEVAGGGELPGAGDSRGSGTSRGASGDGRRRGVRWDGKPRGACRDRGPDPEDPS